MFCGKCGTEITDNDIVCPGCGALTDTGAAGSQSAAESAAQSPKKGVSIGKTAGICAAVLAAAVIIVCAVLFVPRVFKTSAGADGNESVEAGISENNSKTTTKEKENEETDLGEDASVEVQKIALAQEREETIQELAEQKWMLREAARNLAADRLEMTSLVTVDPREEFSLVDVVIDGVSGNVIISEGAKAAYNSAVEGKSLSEICQDAVAGASSHVSEYLTDKAESALKDMVTGVIGIDIFSAVDIINEWNNADDMPTVLLQAIVDEQQRDVYRLTAFLEQEEISAADMYRVAQLMYAIQKREEEIAAVNDDSVGGSEMDYGNMRLLAEQYAAIEEELLCLAELQVDDEVTQMSEAEAEEFACVQQEVSDALAEYEALSGVELGNISANYDVEGFREAQKTISQSGIIGEKLFGSWLGGVASESSQENADWAQENRAMLCDQLTGFMEESYLDAAVAQADFMGQYGFLQWLSSASEEEQYLAKEYLEQGTWRGQLDESAKNYLTALNNYMYDVDSAYILYDCFLSDDQAKFLFDLMLEHDQAYIALQNYSEIDYGADSNEELVDRWCTLLDYYIEVQDMILERGLTLGTVPGIFANGSMKDSSLNYSIYSKEFAEDSYPVMIIGTNPLASAALKGAYRFYYDANGKVLCAIARTDSSETKVVCRSSVDGSLSQLLYLSKTKSGEVVLSEYNWNLSPESSEKQEMDNWETKAEELYSKVVNG